MCLAVGIELAGGIGLDCGLGVKSWKALILSQGELEGWRNFFWHRKDFLYQQNRYLEINFSMKLQFCARASFFLLLILLCLSKLLLLSEFMA